MAFNLIIERTAKLTFTKTQKYTTCNCSLQKIQGNIRFNYDEIDFVLSRAYDLYSYVLKQVRSIIETTPSSIEY